MAFWYLKMSNSMPTSIVFTLAQKSREPPQGEIHLIKRIGIFWLVTGKSPPFFKVYLYKTGCIFFLF
jgi:hypothetical protein